MREWLKALRAGDSLSLYLHIPYCDRLCWFCACHTKHTLKYEPIETYLKALYAEIALVSSFVDPSVSVIAVHFGGGSPTMLKPDDLRRLMANLRSAFTFAANAQISVEMDPNDLDQEKFEALAEIGVTRASLGVQDFDIKVQTAINRPQTFEQTKWVVESVRALDVPSINCDILYGLPHQTLETMATTVSQIISLNPDRIALFGYAHVPWMKKHQMMINEASLPNQNDRYAQFQLASNMLLENGYEPIGIDHFAKPDDSLARANRCGKLARNFQGYTDDQASALLGLGASSISQFPQGYLQNMPATGEYQRMIDKGDFACVRGFELSSEDSARAWLIGEIMCLRTIDLSVVRELFGSTGETLIEEISIVAARDNDGLVELTKDKFCLSPIGVPYARVVASYFDTYLNNGVGRHSVAV